MFVDAARFEGREIDGGIFHTIPLIFQVITSIKKLLEHFFESSKRPLPNDEDFL